MTKTQITLENMQLEDEIEFFEFDPYGFLQKLPDALEESIKSTLDGINIPEKVKRELLAHFTEELRKNYILFEDFCIPQIFTFPNDFVYERKVSDLIVTENIDKIVENIAKLQDEYLYYQSELERTTESIKKKQQETKEMEDFLNNSDVNDLLSNTEFLKKLYKKTKQAIGKNACSISTSMSAQFNDLIENKEIKTEMKKKEINELLNVAQLDDIDAFRKNFLELQN